MWHSTADCSSACIVLSMHRSAAAIQVLSQCFVHPVAAQTLPTNWIMRITDMLFTSGITASLEYVVALSLCVLYKYKYTLFSICKFISKFVLHYSYWILAYIGLLCLKFELFVMWHLCEKLAILFENVKCMLLSLALPFCLVSCNFC